MTSRADGPWQGDAHGLLAVGDHHLTGAEAVQVAGNPDMEAAHVHGQRDVAVDDILHGANDAQGMQGKLVELRAAAVQQLALVLAVAEDLRRLRESTSR